MRTFRRYLYCCVLLSLLGLPYPSVCSAQKLMDEVIPTDYTGAFPTLTVPATYKFVGSDWTQAEKDVIMAAINEWDAIICNQQTFFVTDGAIYNVSLRWGGPDLFKLWPDGTELSDALAFWPIPGVPKPWDTSTYPDGEIYFNSSIPWYIDPNPANDEPFTGYDLYTVAKHEFGHALGIDGDWGQMTVPPPGKSPNEVMWGVLDRGERHHLQPSDVSALQAVGKYHVTPEPGTVAMLISGALGFAPLLIRRRRSR